jgi:hypothetical protein
MGLLGGVAALLLIGCNGGAQTDELSRPVAGSYILVDGAPDQSDAIMAAVGAMLAREPGFRPLALSNGLESATLYSFKFTGSCGTQAALVAAVRAEVARVTKATARCVDRRRAWDVVAGANGCG